MRYILRWVVFGPVLLILSGLCLATRMAGIFARGRIDASSALIFAGRPIPGLRLTGEALREAGHNVWIVANAHTRLGEHEAFDTVLCTDALPPRRRTPALARQTLSVFSRALREYDILHAYVNGGLLGGTPLARFEFGLWSLAGKKLILLTYGSDSMTYSGFPPSPWRQAIARTYPLSIREEKRRRKDVARAARHADAAVGCLIHWRDLPSVTINPLLWYPAEALPQRPPRPSGPIRILHSPNHRAIKGTEALIKAVDALRNDGHDIDFRLIEGQPRRAVLDALSDADIVVDQLLMGYALSALEGMARGKIVITGIDLDDPVYAPHRAALQGCPLVFSRPDKIEADLRALIDRRGDWAQHSARISEFRDQNHSAGTVVAMFEALYARL